MIKLRYKIKFKLHHEYILIASEMHVDGSKQSLGHGSKVAVVAVEQI